MSILVSIATGRRPRTAELALACLRHQYPEMVDHIIVVQWADSCDLEGWRVIKLPGANRAQAHNAAYRWWTHAHGPPQLWFTMDDDVVLPSPESFRREGITENRSVFKRMARALAVRPRCGVLGAWNEGVVPLVPLRQEMAGGEVIVPAVVVGGAFTVIPQRTVQGIGLLDESVPGMEDTEYSQRCQGSGLGTWLAQSISVVLLRSDGLDPTYHDDKWTTYRRTLAAQQH